MTAPLTKRRLFGLPGEDLTGPESRALRTSLNLERRHVVALCNALSLRRDETTAQILTSWERGKERGYPDSLVDVLEILETAVDRLALSMAEPVPPAASHQTLRRPLGAKRILALLSPGQMGLVFDEVSLGLLDQSGGDFWLALADAAVSRAAVLLRRYGCSVSVVMDREPE